MSNKITLLITLFFVISIFASCGNEEESTIVTETTEIEIEIVIDNSNLASDFEFVIEPEQIIITKYIGETADVVIPKEVAGKKVTKIGTAFRGINWITSVVIPDSVTVLDKFAFQKCRSLENVTIPDSVTIIGEAAFYACSSLTSIVIPKSVTEIGDLAFRDCVLLTDITIPDTVTSIGYGAFIGCDLLPENIINKISQINPDAVDN